MANMTEEAADTGKIVIEDGKDRRPTTIICIVLETGVETPTALASDDNGQRSDSPVLRNAGDFPRLDSRSNQTRGMYVMPAFSWAWLSPKRMFIPARQILHFKKLIEVCYP